MSRSKIRSLSTRPSSWSDPKPIVLRPTRSSMIRSSPSKAPPQMKRMFVVSIWMKSWCGCLRPPCGGTFATVPSRIFEQRLLDALAGDVARDRRVVGLPRDLVDLVDVDDPALRPGHVEVGGLDQAEEDVLDVLADVAGLGEARGVRDAERDVQDPGERLREEGLARARGSDEQDVRLLELDVVDLVAGVHPLVVVVDGDGEDLLRALLADHVLVERILDLPRGLGSRGAGAFARGASSISSSMISWQRLMHSSQM